MIRFFLVLEVFFKFLWDFVVAVVEIASWIFRSNNQLRPVIVAMDLDLKSEWTLWTLSMVIFLTPGSLIVHYGEDGRRIYIHFFHSQDPDFLVHRLKKRFELPLIKIFEKEG